MKRVMLLTVLLFSAISVFSDQVDDYIVMVNQKTFKESIFEYEDWFFSIMPMTKESLVLSNFNGWREQRMPVEEMVSEAMSISQKIDTFGVLVLFSIHYSGNSYEDSITVKDKFERFAFLQTDNNNFSRARLIQKSDLGIINKFNKDYSCVFAFSLITESGIDLTKSEKVTFLISSIIKYPIIKELYINHRSMFLDAPDEIKNILIQSGIWR